MGAVQAQAQAPAPALGRLVLRQAQPLHQVLLVQVQAQRQALMQVPGQVQDPAAMEEEGQAMGQAKGVARVLALDLGPVVVRDTARGLAEGAALVKDQATVKVMGMVKARGVDIK